MYKKYYINNLKFILFFLYGILFFLKDSVYSQVITSDFFQYKLSRLLYDSGSNWGSISLFHDIEHKFKNDKMATKSNRVIRESKSSIYLLKKHFSIINYNYLKFQNNFYFFNYLRLGSKINIFRLHGKIDGNNEGNRLEVESSGIGYFNNWVNLKIERGRESWGAGENIELALSSSSEPYNYFSLFSDYGNIRVKYIHGFLEETPSNINRFLTARGLEWTNKKSFIIGFSETIIYSGLYRSLDIGYLNPLSSHLEIELNDRLNLVGDASSNAVWQVNSDWFIADKYRISLNYLFDEFVLDKEVEIGKEHGRAYSLRFSYTAMSYSNSLLTFYGQKVLIGTPTFRHGNGYNNFVQNYKPLGWAGGSDSEELSLGINYSNKSSIIWLVKAGMISTGQESITKRIFDPYEDYLEGLFPSGEIDHEIFLNSKFEWVLKNNNRLFLFINTSFRNKSSILFGLNISVPNFI